MAIRRSAILGTLGAALLMAGTTAADAATPASFYYMKLASGEYGPVNENGGQNDGPGVEQPTVTYIEDGEDVYVIVMWMQTYDEPNNNNVYWQGACSSIKLSKDQSPEIVVASKKISDVNAKRPWNHPALASHGGYAILAWGDNGANGNTRTYVAAYDKMCNMMSDKVRVSNNNNNNDGGPNISFIDVMDGKPWFFVDYLSNGGGNDQTMALAVSFDPATMELNREWITGVVDPCDIARQTHAVHRGSADASAPLGYTLHCAPQGDNRPAEDGVSCAYLNNMTGDIMWNDIIAPSDPQDNEYNTQPDVVWLGGNNFAVQFSQSSGPQGNNNKGTTENLGIILNSVGPEGKQQTSAMPLSPGGYAFHSKVCAGEWGAPDMVSDDGHALGRRFIALMDSSPTGVGQAQMSFVGYNTVLNQFDVSNNRTWIPNPENADGGYLQNIYGANPNNQGRGFQRCLANVPNPAHMVSGGFKADAETLWVWPHAVRRSGDNKLSLDVGFIDGITPVEKQPAVPTDEPEDVNVSDPQTGEPNNPDPGDDSITTPGDSSFSSAESSCSLSNVQGDDDNTGLLALGLGAALVLARRRREEV